MNNNHQIDNVFANLWDLSPGDANLRQIVSPILKKALWWVHIDKFGPGTHLFLFYHCCRIGIFVLFADKLK
jgi:hypothetical protein